MKTSSEKTVEQRPVHLGKLTVPYPEITQGKGIQTLPGHAFQTEVSSPALSSWLLAKLIHDLSLSIVALNHRVSIQPKLNPRRLTLGRAGQYIMSKLFRRTVSICLHSTSAPCKIRGVWR